MQETKCSSSTFHSILSRLWPGCDTTAVDSVRTFGGISITWDPSIISLSHFHASHHFIQASFHLIGTSIKGLLSNVYFPQIAASKIQVLDDLSAIRGLKSQHFLILGGDFNMITSLQEKWGGHSILSALQKFHQPKLPY